MFEISVACKYLIPRRRQLSQSIIGLISVLVIALVVWLVIVFFSVTDGLEKNWIQKLTALTAPVRITPTDAYYHSYYYLIDQISDSSDYSNKTIREKQETSTSDPYDSQIDEEIPLSWAPPDLHPDGSVKDLVKLAYASINEIPGVDGLLAKDFELTATHIQLRLLRHSAIIHSNDMFATTAQSALSYPAFLGNFDADNPNFFKTLLPIEMKDINNVFLTLDAPLVDPEEGNGNESIPLSSESLQRRLANFFSSVTIRELQAGALGWNIPRHLLPSKAEWKASAILSDNKIVRLIAPQESWQIDSLQSSLENQGLTAAIGRALIDEGKISFVFEGEEAEKEVSSHTPITLAAGSKFSVSFDPKFLPSVKRAEDLRFAASVEAQGSKLSLHIPFRGLEISQADISPQSTLKDHLWINPLNSSHKPEQILLPQDPDIGDGIVLPKSFKDAGVLVGDRGSLSYLSPTVSMLQEQQIPVFVAGFYDPGIIPIGGKFIVASQEVASLIRASHQTEDTTSLTNGINVRFNRLDQADFVKSKLLQNMKEKGISKYWSVQTFREFEFTREIMQELQSQKNLFMLIAIVIILVACSNIISMLIILVNDKRVEIGILRSMGATAASIAFIFGLSGAIIGMIGSAAGIAAALLTLHNLGLLVQLLSKLQGHEMFSAALYGETLPSELSFEALSFVLIATVCISLLAGIIPAIKACLLRPSNILRATGG